MTSSPGKSCSQHECVTFSCLSICRKNWESESGKKGDLFDVESMVGTGAGTDYEVLLTDAKKSLWDTFFAPKVPPRISTSAWALSS